MMARIIDYLQERFDRLQLILDTPLIQPTPRRGVLLYCDECLIGEMIEENLLQEITSQLIWSESAEGQYNLKVRWRFIEAYLNDEQYKAYKWEVSMVSWDTKQYLIAIGIRNIGREQRHRHCGLAWIEVDIPYNDRHNGFNEELGHQWAIMIFNEIWRQLPGGRTLLERTRLHNGGQFKVRGFKDEQGRTLDPGPHYEWLLDKHNFRYRQPRNRNNGTPINYQEGGHVIWRLPRIAELDRPLTPPSIRRCHTTGYTSANYTNCLFT